MPRPYGAVVLAVALAVVSGCSFVLVKGPSTKPRQGQPPDCTPSYTPPIVDTVVVGTIGLVVAGAAAGGAPALRGPYDLATLAPDIALWAGVAAVAVSAVYGYVEVAGCRAALATPTMLPSAPPALE